MKKLLLLLCCILACFFTACNNGEQAAAPNPETNQSDISDQAEDKQEPAAPMSRKKALMSSLIGSYPLQSISGLAGMNSMMDYSKKDGNWSASGSSNVGGTREAYDIDLSKEDIAMLNSGNIIVNEDLSVEISFNGKGYFKTAYKEEGIQYELSKAASEYDMAVPDKLEENSNFLGKELFLLAKDQVAEEDINNIDLTDISADALILSYDEEAKAFQLTVFAADCCDNVTYRFQK